MLRISHILVVVALTFPVLSCKGEGERLVDEIGGTLEQTTAILGSDDESDPHRAALEFLESRSVRMRILESRLDDHVRTLNQEQRRELADYATRQLERIRQLPE